MPRTSQLRWIKNLTLFGLLSLMSWALLTACSLKKPEEVTPVPSEQVFHKDFFLNEDGSLRKFLFGVSPESTAGRLGADYTHYNYNYSSHSNIVFDPYASENALIARELNPSRMGRNTKLTAEELKFHREIIRIPVTNRFYLENARDSRGRETNEKIENSGRSHWKARPYLKLNLSQIQILDRTYSMFSRYSIGSITEIEKSKPGEKKFLGFSVMADRNGRTSSHAQAQFRVNFLEYQSKGAKEFQAVPYSERNSKYVNTLHVIGKLANGTTQILNAAHWHIDEKKPIKIRIDNFPKEHIDIAVDTLNEWNIAFTQALHPEIKNPRKNFKKYLVGEVTNEKHAFDLRHPSIHWVADKEISAYGPLGVGMAHADVTNGEIIWGGVTIYGGMIESYVRGALPNSSSLAAPGELAMDRINLQLKEETQKIMNFDSLHENYVETRMGHLQDVDLKPAQMSWANNSVSSSSLANELNTTVPGVVADFMNRGQQAASTMSFTEILGQPFHKFEKNKNKDEDTYLGELKDHSLGRDILMPLDTDLRFLDVAQGWQSAIQANGKSYNEALRSVLKYLLLHEVGHMLGHGHQFKENVVPEPGTVPDKYIHGDPHAELDIHRDGLLKRASAEEHFTNYTSVMGYLDARSEVMLDYDDFVVGPHDVLLTRYLYKGEYPVYKKGDEDFKFEKVGPGGEIPSHSPNNPEYKTAFFPACNDWDVMLSGDPYCDRFVQGSSADDIRISYINRVYDGLANRLISFNPGGGGASTAGWAEYLMWRNALKTMSRLRMFYDHMRQKYDKDLKKIAENEENLYRFYNACTGSGPSNDELDNLFESKPQRKYFN